MVDRVRANAFGTALPVQASSPVPGLDPDGRVSTFAGVARSIRHYLDRLESRENGRAYPPSNPANKTNGYLVAQVPDWALRQWLGTVEPRTIPTALDADGLDIVEALVSDACAAERSCGVHEGASYFAERIIRRAIEQGTLALANPPRGHEGGEA